MNKMAHKNQIRKHISMSTDRVKGDQLIFIVCLVIASLFWFLIKLSGQYSTTYTFSVKYNNGPKEKLLTEHIDSTVNLSLKARGFKVLQLNLFENTEELNIDLSQYKINQKSTEEFFIYTQPIEQRIASLLEIPETEIKFSKTTLSFIMENLHTKTVEVIGKHALEFIDQYDLYEEASIQPREVKLYGPQAVLDTITSIYTEPLLITDIEKSQTLRVKLLNPNPRLLRMSPEEVRVGLTVEKFTETVFEIPIDLSSMEVPIRTFPGTVKVYCKVAQKDFNTIQEAMFRVSPIPYQSKITEIDKLRLHLETKPDFVRNVRIVPSEVEFLILK